ncbi:hypothetical protein ACT7CZ_17315 [Bacillus cereus]
MAVLLVENLYQMSIVLLILCSFVYRYLKKIKEKLTGFEITMYIVTQLAYFIWASTTLDNLSE